MATELAPVAEENAVEWAAWEEYREATNRAPASVYDEVEAWAWRRMTSRLAKAGIYYRPERSTRP